jgi:hypothetical protein
MQKILPALILAGVLAAQAPSPALPDTLQNGAFQEGALGESPMGWFMPKPCRDAGFHCELAEDAAISYAETCLAIVEAYHLGEIAGEPSAGTNGNVNPFALPGGYRISWTGMKVLKHDGTPHHGVGIHPTVRVQPTIQGLAQGRDEVLEKGLELVSR